jgi:hypothetical protein
MTTQQVLAFIRLIIVISAVVVILRNRCEPHNLPYSAPYLLWLGHAFIYLVTYLVLSAFFSVHPEFYNVWSASLQIQGFLTVFIVEVFRYYRQKQRGGNSEC